MFQTYETLGGPALGRAHLPLLRAELARAGLDGFIVPHEDEYQNEYVPPAFDRLGWLTGFTGSAGAAIVLADKAAIFVDGRYTLQARNQVDGALFEQRDLIDNGAAAYLRAHAKPGMKIGYDPKLLSPDTLAKFQAAAKDAQAALAPVETNPIDAVWADRPAIPAAQVYPYPLEHAGEASAAKRTRLGEEIAKAGAAAALITAPASLAWLFNIRGGDVKATPLPLGAAILRADSSAELFLAPEKVSPDLRAWLGNDVALRAPGEIEAALAGLKNQAVRVDPQSASAWYFDRLEKAGATIVRGPDPVEAPRAAKNETELDGARRAHLRDGAALTRFLHWIATHAQSHDVTEIEACRKLEAFRSETGLLRDLSFDSISGAGAHGAIVHYRVTEATDRKLERDSLFLIDSGGQYLDGTTDVTRTVAIGEPSREMQERFTRVLKGHIALARVRFPPGTSGHQLDALARLHLWAAGLDYDHGTGHGVGVYLGVHEGPQRIAKAVNAVALKPGMIISNEPGYYKEGGYGIRIENLQIVTPAEDIAGGERPMHGFETLTLAPIDRRLIVAAMLDSGERAWLDGYHARVLTQIGPLLDAPERAWLALACAAL